MVPGKSFIPFLNIRISGLWLILKDLFTNETETVFKLGTDKKNLALYVIKADLEQRRFQQFLSQHRLFPISTAYKTSERIFEVLDFKKDSPKYSFIVNTYLQFLDSSVEDFIESSNEKLLNETAGNILDQLIKLKVGFH